MINLNIFVVSECTFTTRQGRPGRGRVVVSLYSDAARVQGEYSLARKNGECSPWRVAHQTGRSTIADAISIGELESYVAECERHVWHKENPFGFSEWNNNPIELRRLLQAL